MVGDDALARPERPDRGYRAPSAQRAGAAQPTTHRRAGRFAAQLVPEHRAGRHCRRRPPPRRQPSVFAGGVLGAPGSDGVNRNFIFDLCDKRSVDGVVVLGGALGNHLGPKRSVRSAPALAPLPIASVAMAPPGVPSLLVDEEPGMRQALEHLVSRHGCRRIAFIRGPDRQRRGRAPLRRLPRGARGARPRARPQPGVRRELRKALRRGRGRGAARRAQGVVRRPGRVERLHGAGRDPGARSARPRRPVRCGRDRFRRPRGCAIRHPAADHRAPAALPAGRVGPRPRAGADRRRARRRRRRRRPPSSSFASPAAASPAWPAPAARARSR